MNMAKNINETHAEKLSSTEKLAITITGWVGTFGCFILFSVLAFISLPSVIAAHSTIIWISWVTQSFLQLVLLPLIMISQNIDSKHAELMAENDYESDIKTEKDIQEINRKLDLLLQNEK